MNTILVNSLYTLINNLLGHYSTYNLNFFIGIIKFKTWFYLNYVPVMTFTIDLIYNTHMKTIQAINSYKIKAFLDKY